MVDSMVINFYSKTYDLDIKKSELMARFIGLCDSLDSIVSYRIFNKNGMIRVYFEVWSQNKMEPIGIKCKSYYDCIKCDVFFDFEFLNTRYIINIYSLIKNTPAPVRFSGAKTKAAINRLMEEYYGKS